MSPFIWRIVLQIERPGINIKRHFDIAFDPFAIMIFAFHQTPMLALLGYYIHFMAHAGPL